MAKRIQTNDFIKMLKVAFGKSFTKSKAEIAELATEADVSVPKEFWDSYKIKRGYWGIEAKDAEPEEEAETIDDGNFTINIETNEIFKSVEVICKISGKNAVTSMAVDGNPTRFINYYKKEFTELLKNAEKKVDTE